MVQRMRAVLKLKRGRIDATPLGLKYGPAVTFGAKMLQVRGQPVAYVDARMHFGHLMQLQRFAHPRCKGKVFPENAASERSRYKQPVAWSGFGAQYGPPSSGLADQRD